MDRLNEAIANARKIADDQPAVYRVVTFELAVNYLLKGQDHTVADAVTSPVRPSIPTQLNEFLASKRIESHPDRITAIAYYAHRTGNSDISTKDILDAYGRARLRKPQNVHDVIGTCIRRGFLIDTDKKNGMRAWLITPSGESYVEEKLATGG